MNNKIKKLMTSSLIGMLVFSASFSCFSGEYGSWKKLKTYPGLQFRTKCGKDIYTEHGWRVEIFNGYKKNVTTWVLATNTNVKSTANKYFTRFPIKSGNTTSNFWTVRETTSCTDPKGISIWTKDTVFK